jgi:cation transport regulator ChaC
VGRAVVSGRIGLFAYGSLVSLASAERTLGRPLEHAGLARLPGWRRRWSQMRNNRATEKTFARADGGAIPPYTLGLNVERDTSGPGPNGALLEVSQEELRRLAAREIRYDEADVTATVTAAGIGDFARVVMFTAKPENFAPSPPSGAVIIASYARAVEAAFESLGSDQVALFRETTGSPPVEVIEAVLVRDEIPPGNPREW